jgi:hypothetical protein
MNNNNKRLREYTEDDDQPSVTRELQSTHLHVTVLSKERALIFMGDFTIPNLKYVLRQIGMKQTGKKNNLIERLEFALVRIHFFIYL